LEMYARWREDCLNLRPTLVSILIGVNDTIFEFKYFAGNGPERFKMIYELAVQELLAAVPACVIVVCEPFLLRTGEVTDLWMEHLGSTQQVVRDIATKYSCIFVPFQEIFNRAIKCAPAEHWLHDGIHPTPAGVYLMASSWQEKVRLPRLLALE
jgi:lysophospholipase L1-like esterase